jgi:16S rRNA (guanine527-N7)-methyltransferase
VSSTETNFEPLPAALNELLTAEGVVVPADQLDLLDLYRRQLWMWNERMNLTRHTTLEKFVSRDIVDSYQLSLLLERGERVLDVGTGGGVPGIPMAILRSDLTVNLCESTQKKARAVEAMVGELGLPISVFATRAEEVLQVSTFDTLVARGLASLSKILTWFAPHWDAFDRLLLIKGPSWAEERADARHLGLLRGLELRKDASYNSRQTGAESTILSIRRSET